MPNAKVNGISIAYDSTGPAGRTLLLLHGHPFDRSMWRPQIEPLVKLGWQIVAPDLRGYGESSVVPGKTPFPTFAHDAVGLLHALGIESAVVAGLSMGGQIAMEVARLFPGRVEGLILAATFPQAETDAGRIRRSEVALRLTQEGMDRYALETLPSMLGPTARAQKPDVVEHVLAMMRGAPPVGAAAALRGRAERPDYGPTLKALSLPALIVAGTEDVFTTRKDAERLRALLKGSDLVWLEGVGHLPNLEHPDAFNRAVARFLQRMTDDRAPGPGEAPAAELGHPGHGVHEP